jgi:hypothetical protein
VVGVHKAPAAEAPPAQKNTTALPVETTAGLGKLLVHVATSRHYVATSRQQPPTVPIRHQHLSNGMPTKGPRKLPHADSTAPISRKSLVSAFVLRCIQYLFTPCVATRPSRV